MAKSKTTKATDDELDQLAIDIASLISRGYYEDPKYRGMDADKWIKPADKWAAARKMLRKAVVRG